MYRENDTIGPYTLRRKLGKGAFGIVWLADKRTAFGSFEYAIKMAARDDIDLAAVAEEVTTWKDAKGHPNVLPLIDADVYGEDFVIVSEFAPDGSLQGWLDANGGRAPDTETAVKMTNSILDGLIHLHAKRIIHRDLKPDNILLRGTTPMLADFGLARVLKTSQSSNIAGTPVYMSPEAIRNARTVQVDVWAVGVLLYQMLAGRLPFAGDNIMSLMYAIMHDAPAPLPLSVPAGLREIVARALQKDTAQRQPTAQVMRDELRAFTEQQAEARRRAARQATEQDLAQRLAQEAEARRQVEAERQRQEAARLRAEEVERQRQEAARLRAEEAERQRQQEAARLRAEAVRRQQAEEAERQRQAEAERQMFRVPPSGGPDVGPEESRITPLRPLVNQRDAVVLPPSGGTQNPDAVITTPNSARRKWWLGAGAAAVLSVSLLGYGLSGKLTNSVATPIIQRSGETTPVVGKNITFAKATATTMLPGNVKLEFVLIPSGNFTMGSPTSEAGRFDNEGPQHNVTIRREFYLGRYEVTQAQWQAVMGSLPAKCDYGSLTGEFVGDDKPIICVSWDDAQQFIGKLNAQASDGGKYRLPTEAEWEYAARATTTGPYGGTGNLDEMGWYDKNSGGKTHRVGEKKANKFGLYDMHGNVWEWCGDLYGSYSAQAVMDPTGPATGSRRVDRGGGWGYPAALARSAGRDDNAPGDRINGVGFRLARTPS